MQSLRPHTIESEPAWRPRGLTGRRLVIGALAVCMASLCIRGWRVETPSGRTSIVREEGAGRARLRTTPSGVDEKWQAREIEVTIDPTLAAIAPGAREAVIRAFGAWMSTGAALPAVSVETSTTKGEAAYDGVNRLLVGPITAPGREYALAITISYADETTGEIVEADTIFNSAVVFGTLDAAPGAGDDGACDGRYDLQNVAAHEAGHFFGLGEDYDNTTTTMYVSSLPCQTSKRVLTSTDVSVVSQLYRSAPSPRTVRASCAR